MNTVAVKCCGCQQQVNAAEMKDGTHMMICTNIHCNRRGKWTRIVLDECKHCTAPIVGYEQETLPGSRFPRLFMATCTNPDCTNVNNTYTITRERPAPPPRRTRRAQLRRTS